MRVGRRRGVVPRPFALAIGLVGAVHGTAYAQRAWKTPGESDAATARRLASSGRCDEALAPFDAAIEARTEEASLRRDRGVCHENLGHPAPAIEDYRAYLSMDPEAQDAGVIRAKLDALESAEQSPAGKDSPLVSRTSPGQADRDEKSSPSKGKEGLPDSGDITVGLHIGERGWSQRGYTEPTVAWGISGAYAYAKSLEVDARLVFLRTNGVHSSGFGAVLDNTAKLGLDSAHNWELALALGVGYESQSNDAHVPRTYFFGHVNPKVRFAISGQIMIEAAPEMGVGLMEQEALGTLGGTALTFFYGGYARLCWIIRGS